MDGGHISRLARDIKRVKPAGIVCTNRAGEEVHIALSGSRMRWERAAKAIVSVDATEVRLLDADGGVLEVVEGPVAPERKAQLAKTQTASEVEALVRVALDAADRAVSRQQDMMRDLCVTALDLARTAQERTDKLDRMVQRIVEDREAEVVAARNALAKHTSKGEEPDAGAAMGDMMMAMLAARMGIPLPPGMMGAAAPAPAPGPTVVKNGKH